MDKPERGVDRVVFRLLACIGEAVRHHAFGHVRGEGGNDLPGHIQSTGDQAEAGQRDERVASPIGKPGIPGYDRLLVAPLGQITFRSTPEFASQRIIGWGGLPDCVTARLLTLRKGDDVEPVDGLAGEGHGLGGSGLKFERELSGRPPVFFAIESALLFDGELYVPIPMWFMAIPS